MLTNPYTDVGEFHLKFGLRAFEQGPPDSSDFDLADMLLFRFRFLVEELEEIKQGIEARDDAQIFDGLMDLVYVAVGTAHLLGYPWHQGWHEVQKANMAKERATSAGDIRSTRKNSLDVVKPEGWKPPRIREVLAEAGFEL